MTEPRRICRNCQHFDGGGIDKHGQPLKTSGDCHNLISGRYTTTADNGCDKGFYPCTVRWPLKAGTGGVR